MTGGGQGLARAKNATRRVLAFIGCLPAAVFSMAGGAIVLALMQGPISIGSPVHAAASGGHASMPERGDSVADRSVSKPGHGASVHHRGAGDENQPLAPGYRALGYALPKPGSYDLPPLSAASDGQVVDQYGDPGNLHQHFDGKYVLMGFIYTSCTDRNGCPLINMVFYQVKAAMRKDPVLADKLKLLSVSFDQQNDTPEVMRTFGENFKYAGESGQWSFVTTGSQSELDRILADYGQDVQPMYTEDGKKSGVLSHLIRVYLIDPFKRIRNIYNADFLHKDMVLNDFQNLLLEENNPALLTLIGGTGLAGPGDHKENYEAASYQTQSKFLPSRVGEQADLMALAKNPPLGLPPLSPARAETLSPEKITLGRRLFFDRRLSLNNTISCAMCHVPEQGFTSNELSTAVGFEGRSVFRNTPSLFNVGYASTLFHDARERSLVQQVWGPLLAANEMANPSVGAVVDKIHRLPEYTGQFEAAFSGKPASMETIGEALAAYQTTLLAADSPFDRWYYGGDEGALSQSAQRGFALFTGSGGCSSCHLVGEQGALFSDYQVHNTGMGYRHSMRKDASTQRVLLAPGVYAEVDAKVVASVGNGPVNDLGRYRVSQDPADRWKFKTPSLRNVAMTAPYMHSGELETLESVIEFYNQGGEPNDLLDPRIRPLGLSDQEKADLLAFLHSLTAGNTDQLISDAFAAPVGDVAGQGR